MFKSMALGKKIGLGFGIVIVFLCAVGVTGYLSMNTATENVNSIVAQLEIAKKINTVLTDSQDAQAGSLRLIIYDDDKYYNMIEAEAKAASEHTQEAKSMMKSAENRANADAVADQINAYVKANKDWHQLQVQRREGGKVRAQAAGVVLSNIKDLLEAQENAIRATVTDTDDGQVAEFGVVERTLKAQEARNAFNRVRVCAQKYQLAKTAAAQDAMAQEWVAEIDTTKGVITDCKGIMKDPTALKYLDNCLTALDDYSQQVERFRQINKQQRAIQSEKMKPAADTLMAKSRTVRDGVYDFIDNVNEESDESMAFASLLITSMGIGAVIIAVLCAVIITRAITGPLNRIIGTLNDGADQVNDAASQVSSASQQLAEGASEQASSLEETSAALEEMAAMTRTNAENAKEANNLSGQARDAARSGDKTMDKLNSAMGAINESSGQISRIIKVIEEIAFQTNLLALNAAVEAARAGEHGKGFAVVADEVRNLAQRAAQAAGETTSLIEDSVTRAKEGTDVAGDVGKSLGAIVADVTRVTDLIEGISKASQEQAQGVDQVNTAVSQMDKVTQQNASGAEESASASEELSAQAQAVKGIVGELSQIVSGASLRATSKSSQTTPPPGSRPKQAAYAGAAGAASHDTHAEQPVAAGAKASEEFLAMDDKSGVQDF